MSIIVLIPALVCLIALARGPVWKAFLDVYLPIFLLFPIYYFWKVPALPAINFSEAVLLPLGVAILLKELPRWRFTLMDLWMVLFMYSAYNADALAGRRTTSIFDLFQVVLEALVPYMIGKLLIEQHGIRVKAVKRFVFLLFLACIVSAYEYRMGQNPFARIWRSSFPGEMFAWKTQIRWGFGRVSGPFGQSELAGIIFLAGLVFALWLGYCQYWEPKFRLAPKAIFGDPSRHPFSKSAIITWTIGLTLLMTQARGPWLGTIFAVPVSLLGRSRRVLRASLLTALFLILVGGSAYIGLKNYATTSAPASNEQETAQYRQQLISNYIPVAQDGGAWGWGQNFPRVGGQGSIDNEYLFVALTQGWVGLGAFCLLGLEALVRLGWAAAFGPTRTDRYFAFSLLGIMAGLLITISTVYLGLQPYQLFFLLAGWAQAVRPKSAAAAPPAFERVYT